MPYFEVQLTKKLHRIYDVAHDTTIGRAPQCHIQLLSRAVSRRHARIELDEANRVVISDLGTKNGIKLNGQRVQGAAIVKEGDQVVVGNIQMTYRSASRSIAAGDVVDLRNVQLTPEHAELADKPQASFLIAASEHQIASFQAAIARGRIEGLRDFDELSRFKLQIALKEAMDNARLHGCQGDPGRGIVVTFGESEEEFVISVKDEGQGYDVEGVLANAEEVDALEAIRNRERLGPGMGLRIILNCVDRLQFEGRGATIHMGRIKEAGQMFVIADDDVVDAGAGAAAGVPGPPAPMPGATPPGDALLETASEWEGLATDETEEFDFNPFAAGQPGPEPATGERPFPEEGGRKDGDDGGSDGPISLDELF